MFTVPLFTTAKLWKQSRCLQLQNGFRKYGVMDYYSAIKMDEIMLFVGKWMELKISMLSKVSQGQKDEGHVLSHVWKTDLKDKLVHKYTKT
jgi:hypothetical protein